MLFRRSGGSRERRLLKRLAELSRKTDRPFSEVLESLAEALVELSGAGVGAALALFEQGKTFARPPLIAEGRSLLALNPADPDLKNLPAGLRSGEGVCELRLAEGEKSEVLTAVEIEAKGDWQIAILLPGEAAATREAQEILNHVGPWIAMIILQALSAQAENRIEKLHDLVRRELRKKDPSLPKLVSELKTIFEATVATVLLAESASKTLRLSCSTDGRLGRDRPVVYRENQGWTGFVFASGRSLRVADLEDSRAIEEEHGLDPGHPYHEERTPDGEQTIQFLGVPIRGSEEPIGVLRLSRAGNTPRFTAEDQAALEFFADLLGIALKRTWRLIVAKAVNDSTSIGIAISHREEQPDESWIPRLRFVNPGALKILGYTKEDVEGADARKLYALNDYEILRGKLKLLLTEKGTTEPKELGPEDVHLLHKDKSPRAVKISYRILEDSRIQPPATYTIGIFRDRTEEAKGRAQHSRLMEMLGEMGIAYFRSTPAGKTVETSAAEAEILGYSASALIQLDRVKLYETFKDRKTLIDDAISKPPGQLTRVRQPLIRSNGERIETAGYMRTVRDRMEGDQVTVEGLYQDVTQRLELQRFVDLSSDDVLDEDELLKKLTERQKRQQAYLSSLGHQLVTPLASLVGNLEDLKSGLLEDRDEIETTLTWVIGQTGQCMRMVQNLSYLDKILRREPLDKQHLSLAKLCIETRHDFLHQMEAKHLKVYVNGTSIDQHIGIVLGHPDLLRQVIINLVDNALKYSKPYSAIRVYADSDSEGPKLEVSNEGLPVPKALRKRIFDRGVRTNRARQWIPDGTGLGLWLVKLIVEAHGGSIVCDGERDGRGRRRNVFRLRLPLVS